MEPTNAPTPESIRRYLLGASAPAERERIERQLLADRKFYDEVCACEDELLDEYIGGGLAARERENFESIFLAAPERGQKLRFALALRRRIDKSAPPPPPHADPATLTAAASRFGFFHRLSQPARAAFASALLLASVGAILLAVRASRQQSPPPAAHDTAANTARPSESHAAPAPTARPNARSKSLAKTIAIRLTPGLQRGGDETRREIIPTGTDLVCLKLLVAPAEHASYQASVQNLEGGEVSDLKNLTADSSGGESAAFVAAELPASALASGDYRVKLSGVREGGDPEPVATYLLRIHRE